MKTLLLLALLAMSAGADPVTERALAALGKLPAYTQLSPLNTPSDTESTPAGWSWSTQVLADVAAPTPRVRVCAVGPEASRHWVVAFRKVYAPPCLVAKARLQRGSQPVAADVAVEPRPLYPGQVCLGRPQELAGQRLRRNLAPGELVRPQDLEPVPVYEAGASLTVTSPGRGVVLRREARALEPAFPGRPFRVKTADGRTLSVELSADHQVIERSLTP